MQLSQEQSQAVLTASRNVLVIAGAGSGKTIVLIRRIIHLLENCHASPYEIIALTFTRKAGGEMKDRLEKIAGPKSQNVTIGTFHSIALKMIQRFGEFIGLNPGKITIYSTWEESFLLKNVCLELGYHTGKTFKGVKKSEIDDAFNLFYTKKQRNERNYIPNEIMDAFFGRCRENNALTYGMIMTSFLDLIPRIGHFLKFKHVLIDEVQDLDSVQWRIIKLICSICDASLFAVGDQQQCIYQWRGSDPGYLIRNQDKFDIYKLADNYRSDGYIVEAANKLIKRNINRLDLKMNAVLEKVNKVNIFRNFDSATIAFEIEKTLKESDGTLEKSGSIAVLARNHYLLEKLSALLTASKIDHEYLGKKTKFTQSEPFRRVHALLKLAVNPFDNFSFLLAKDYLDLTPIEYISIRMHAVSKNKSHFQVWRDDYAFLFRDKIELIKAIENQSFADVLDWMLGVTFEFDSVPVFDFIDEYLESAHEPTIRDYLDWLALYDVQDEISEESKSLQLMTIHASKGLEFSVVIIAGLNEGILPSLRALKSQDELESERRLAYVAFTRACDHLVLTSRPVEVEGKSSTPISRFINESLINAWG